ncbi:DNA helicase UvrD, partial [Candidatus Woesearchaeota archaeon]|nr:DNA helicase UvrD [Candidatus Woesearchaeota archaeon]
MPMRVIADLHIHSKHSRGCSKDLDIDKLEKYAKLKGTNLLGTGDFTHPLWQKELRQKLMEDGTGILKSKTGMPFILQTEISLIYSQEGKGRKVHNVVLAKNFEIMDQITEALKKKGRVDYDGRPIFGIPCINFVEMMQSIDNSVEVIPAHARTPLFSLFGSNSGFDSIKACFGDQAKHIHAIETGLSSDPPMNWRLSQLDSVDLVSSSDCHSYWPWRMGREATIFDVKELAYDAIIKAIRSQQVAGTIEVDPNYGKYHFDGHRNCDVVMTPKESIAHKNICPKCKRPLTIGVLHRVEELADRELGFKPKHAKPFYTLLPLSELLSGLYNTVIASKKVWEAYTPLINTFESEFNVLMNVPEKELLKVTHPKIAHAILLNRQAAIKVKPGYDGEYGVPIF